MSLQGQSLATIDKERRIGSALHVGMGIASDRFPWKPPYWHFDANAGSGFNEEIGVPGSPLVFCEMADRRLTGLRPIAFFCDFNKDRMLELQNALPKRWLPHSYLLPGDNEDGLLLFGHCIQQSDDNPKFAIGTIVVDPNGYYYRNKKNEGAPIKALGWFLPRFPRIDLILNLNLSAYWKQKAQGHVVCPPRDLLPSLHKKHWLVGLTANGGNVFLIAIGRNVPTRDHAALGLFRSESENGRHVLEVAQGGRQSGLSLHLPKLRRRIPPTSRILGRTRYSDEASELALPLRLDGNGGSSRKAPAGHISAVGNVRRTVEPDTDLSRLPLPGAWEE